MIAGKVPKFRYYFYIKLSEVTSNWKNDLSLLFPGNHEEVNTRIFFHLSNAAQYSIIHALISTVDADVVAIVLVHFIDLEIDDL